MSITPTKRTSEEANLGSSPLEPPSKITGPIAAAAQSCFSASSSSSSSAPTAPYFNPSSSASYPMAVEAPPQSDVNTLYTKFTLALSDLFDQPKEQLKRMRKIIDHPCFSSFIKDENAQYLLDRICAITPSFSLDIVSQGLSCAEALLTKKSNLLNIKANFDKVMTCLVLISFNNEEILHKQAGEFFIKVVFPKTPQPSAGLLEYVKKYAPSVRQSHSKFFNFLLTLPEVRKCFPPDLYERLITDTLLSDEVFNSLITIPSISIPKTRQAVQSGLYKFDLMLFCLEKRPEVLNAEMAFDLAQRLLQIFFLDFPLTFHSKYLNYTPEKAKEAFLHLIRQDLSGIDASFFSKILAFITANRERIPNEIDQAVMAASALPEMRLQAPRVLARGLAAAPQRGTKNPQTALERCVQNPIFEPRVFSIVKSFLVKTS
jgi:hypothetical protein